MRLAFGFATIAALYGLDWLALAPNRLLPGQPVFALQVLGPLAHVVAALVVAAEAAGERAFGRLAALGALVGAIGIALAGTGAGAALLAQGQPPAARVTLGSGFWLGMAALVFLTFERARQTRWPWAPALVAAILALLVVVGFAAGRFDSLSLAVEYTARSAEVHAALRQHLALASGALLIALAAALPLGWAAFRSARAEAVANAVLGAVQVTPAIALFGLLVPALAALLGAVPALREIGLGAIGPTPALIGGSVYLMMPLLRGLVSGLKSTDPAAIEAAEAMGMTPARTILEVRIPLGLPILMSALRVAAVQSIGLVTLGGLIGAGGLGAIVFEGMSQFAADLILLGAIPVVALALAVDAGMAWASQLLKVSP